MRTAVMRLTCLAWRHATGVVGSKLIELIGFDLSPGGVAAGARSTDTPAAGGGVERGIAVDIGEFVVADRFAEPARIIVGAEVMEPGPVVDTQVE